jgi:hypothetical protein
MREALEIRISGAAADTATAGRLAPAWVALRPAQNAGRWDVKACALIVRWMSGSLQCAIYHAIVLEEAPHHGHRLASGACTPPAFFS